MQADRPVVADPGAQDGDDAAPADSVLQREAGASERGELKAPRFAGAGGLVDAAPIPTAAIDRGSSGEAGWDAFRTGFLVGGGDPSLLERFVSTLSCEGSQWSGYHGENDYWSRAQFSLDTWAKVVAHFGVTNEEAAADDPYFVGRAVAWWASLTVPGEQWPVCWIRG
jgi:hypothetical protein